MLCALLHLIILQSVGQEMHKAYFRDKMIINTHATTITCDALFLKTRSTEKITSIKTKLHYKFDESY